MTGFTAWSRARQWLFDTLTTPPIAGVVGVYEDAAPAGVTAKDDIWIEFGPFAPATDVAEVSAQRIWTEFPVDVRAIRRGRDTASLGPVYDEIDARLHRASGPAGDDGQVISSTRGEEFPPEPLVDQGIEYRALGGLYHLLVQPTNP